MPFANRVSINRYTESLYHKFSSYWKTFPFYRIINMLLHDANNFDRIKLPLAKETGMPDSSWRFTSILSVNNY